MASGDHTSPSTNVSKLGPATFVHEGQAALAVEDAIDLARYPFADLHSQAAQILLERCRLRLAASGACELPQFLTPSAIEVLRREAITLVPAAFHNQVVGNAYLEPEPADLPADDPRQLTETTSLGVIAYDQIPQQHLLRRLYEWDPLMQFVGAILELPRIYRYADPMGALNIAVMKNGDYLRWHFDQTDFVTSLAIDAPEQGGEFEYVPMIRNDKNENYPGVYRILKGSRDGVVRLSNEPGTLTLFRGRHSLHRVTPIDGTKPRLMGLLAYDAKPGVSSTDHLRSMRYGRSN